MVHKMNIQKKKTRNHSAVLESSGGLRCNWYVSNLLYMYLVWMPHKKPCKLQVQAWFTFQKYIKRYSEKLGLKSTLKAKTYQDINIYRFFLKFTNKKTELKSLKASNWNALNPLLSLFKHCLPVIFQFHYLTLVLLA